MTPAQIKREIEASSTSSKIIMVLLSLVITLGSAWAVNVNQKLDALMNYNQMQDSQIYANKATLYERGEALKQLQVDIRELRADVRAILTEVKK